MSETLYKFVNGEMVELSSEEIIQRQSEWDSTIDQATEMALEFLRSTRNNMLADTDFIVIKSNEQGTPVPEDWKTYRQALRDITETYSSLEDVVWPTKPT